jgi:hypothetical protein
MTDHREAMRIPIAEIIKALERESANTDTDPRWRAAQELRRIVGWETRTLVCAALEQKA